MKISFLIQNVYGIGGTNRTVLNLAGGLASRHEVEIVSVFRRQDRMMFDVPPGVRVRPLVDLRAGMPDRDEEALAEPSGYVPPSEEYFGQYSALTDARISRHLAETDADVLIGTRPALNLLVARFGRDGAVRVAQEHMTHEMLPPSVRAAYREWYPRLDLSVTVTEADARVFHATTPIPGLRLCAVPNGVPAAGVEPGSRAARLVVAAGRLDPVKRYDVLIHAWAKVAAARPDWRLRIYGDGPEASALRTLATELGLHNQVQLMGRRNHLETEWVKGSIAAVTSAKESFGMTIVEAMRCGLPVVSTDCPVGPGEIITHGVDGLLVPPGDDQAVADALLRLIEDEDLRERMGAAAFASSRRYDPREITARYEELLLEAGAARGLRLRAAGGRRAVAAATGLGTTVDRAKNLAGLVVPGRVARRLGIETTLTADCTLLADGSLRVELAAETVPLLSLDLACRPRGDREGLRLRRFPLGRAVHGRRGAVIPPPGNPDGLTEERWDLFLEEPGGTLQRLKPGLLDTRVAAAADPADPHGPSGMAVPYATRDGNLALQCWRRGARAEVIAVEVEHDTIVIRGQRPQEPAWQQEVELLLRRRVDGLELRASCTGHMQDGTRVIAEVPVQAMVNRRLTRHDDWDVWLAPAGRPAGEGGNGAGDEDAVRIGRFFDDITYKKPVFVYPELHLHDPYLLPQPGLAGEEDVYDLEESPSATIKVKAYFNPENELSVYVDERSA